MVRFTSALVVVLTASLPAGLAADNAVPFTADAEEEASPSWSPNETHIAFTRGNVFAPTIWVKPAAGGDAVQMVVNSGAKEPCWSPGGGGLFWTRLGVLWVVDLSPGGNGDHIQLTSNADGGTSDEAPAVSPLNNRIAFHTILNGESNRSIATAPFGGPAVVTRLTTSSTDNRWPTWSPDGQEIAFTAGAAPREILVIPADGGLERNLTQHAADDLYPSWSPDGNWIAFTSSRAGNHDIWMLPARGGAAVHVTDDPANDVWPRWSPDGRHLVFHSFRGGQSDLWIIPVPQVTVEAMHWGAVKRRFGG
jgi:TolB protein